MKKQSKNSNKMKASKVVIFTLVIGAACALVAVILFFATKQPSRAQIDALDKASEDLYQLYTQLTNSPGVDATSASFKKTCHQASAKFSEGAITCGPEGRFVRLVSYDIAKEDNGIEAYIQQEGGFSSVTTDEFNKGYEDAWLNISFIHTETSIKCSVSLSAQDGATVHRLYCFETVPNFLPGYTVE